MNIKLSICVGGPEYCTNIDCTFLKGEIREKIKFWGEVRDDSQRDEPLVGSAGHS